MEIQVTMNNSAGIFQVEETLTKKVLKSPLRPYVTVVAMTDGEGARTSASSTGCACTRRRTASSWTKDPTVAFATVGAPKRGF